MKLPLLFVFLLVSIAAYADRWTYFHPETVLSFSCKITDVVQEPYGEHVQREVWEAQASAKRQGQPDWGMSLAQFPLTLKGRHDAEKACSKWMDEASKRVKAAR